MRRMAMVTAMLLSCVAAWATTVIPKSVEELARSATAVVEARAVSSRAAWNPQHTLIYTYTTFQVGQAVKGAIARTITVKQLGGSAEGYTQKVAGVHHAQAGEEALLFLRPSAAGDGTYVVVGLVQGFFRAFRGRDGQTMVTNGIGSARAQERGAAGNTEFSAAPMSLREAEARVGRTLR